MKLCLLLILCTKSIHSPFVMSQMVCDVMLGLKVQTQNLYFQQWPLKIHRVSECARTFLYTVKIKPATGWTRSKNLAGGGSLKLVSRCHLCSNQQVNKHSRCRFGYLKKASSMWAHAAASSEIWLRGSGALHSCLQSQPQPRGYFKAIRVSSSLRMTSLILSMV